MKDIETEVRKKFVEDTGLPIKVLESPYFEYFLDLYEPALGSETSWISLQKEISDSFEGKPGKWFEENRRSWDNMLREVLESPDYKRFNGDQELDKTLRETPGEVKKSLYSGANTNKKFLSIDLSRANFQALHWYDPKIFQGEDTWEGFLGKYTSSESLIRSKRLRQVFLGKTNPSRIIRVIKYLVWKITSLVTPHLPEDFILFSRETDEVIWEVPEDYIPSGGLEENLVREVKDILGIDVRVCVFTLGMIQRFTHSGASILGFIKDFAYPVGKKSELKGVPGAYYPQIYKAWKGLDLSPTYDLVLYHEGELARFDYALSYTNGKETENNI